MNRLCDFQLILMCVQTKLDYLPDHNIIFGFNSNWSRSGKYYRSSFVFAFTCKYLFGTVRWGQICNTYKTHSLLESIDQSQFLISIWSRLLASLSFALYSSRWLRTTLVLRRQRFSIEMGMETDWSIANGAQGRPAARPQKTVLNWQWERELTL